ncbi:PspA/IM30 family protein [Ammoniphilus sp. CFH 90114]|uniref:PspA/IM30 family protein n=1 Tax=Ammoniphilus sp. CFH 90114 TaxID=2493665 RepID=UPI00100ED22C|nr:PspA/IM30 family protein [Ammoniphilus sp. CFH 90114]RXT06527.1 PspA/IM30 family protein [Ammoniphilus sp. CFH 90114]
MSLFHRLRNLTLSNIYSFIDKAEDPIKMTDQYLRNMQADIEEAEKAVATQIAIEKKFKQLYEEQEALVTKRDEQAHLAAQAKNIDLARRALEEKKIAEQKKQEYLASYELNKTAADTLREKLADMRNQITQLKSKREALVARANAAKAQKGINKAMTSISSSSAVNGLNRMQDKVLQLEAEAEASHDMNKREKSLDEEFANLEKNNEIEEELTELLKKYES